MYNLYRNLDYQSAPIFSFNQVKCRKQYFKFILNIIVFSVKISNQFFSKNVIIEPCLIGSPKTSDSISFVNIVSFYKFLVDELERLQQLTKQLNKSLESSGLSALPGTDLDLMQDSQTFIKKAREETDNSRSTLLRIQSNCKTLVQAMTKK